MERALLILLQLTPFVAKSIDPKDKLPRGENNEAQWHYEPKKVDAIEYLEKWSRLNPEEFHNLWNRQDQQRKSRELQAQKLHSQSKQPLEEEELEFEFEAAQEQPREQGQTRTERIP